LSCRSGETTIAAYASGRRALILINAAATGIARLPAVDADGNRTVGDVIFRCQRTGQEFDSGFQANSGDMQFLPADAKIRLRCRICGEFHEFQFASAKIDESDEGNP
jgi:hypothetical protein